MNIQIIIGSTRPGRMTERASQWIAQTIEKDGKATAAVVDLRDYPLELFDEAISPQYNPERKPAAAVLKLLDKLTSADAYIIVTPEYNRAIPAVLKNALDYVDFQLSHKPVAIVSHGTVGGGFASANLRTILPQLGAVIVPATVYLVHLSGLIDEQGKLSDEASQNPYGPNSALRKVLDETYWLTESLAK